MELSAFAALTRGKTVGVLAVSSPTEQGRLDRGIQELIRLGLHPRLELNPSAQYGKKDYLFSSDSALNRAEALHRLLRDPDVVAILAVRGAYGSIEVAPLLDLDLIAKAQKPLIGFSDVTALLNLWVRAGAPAIHGVNLDAGFASAADKPDSRRSVDELLRLLRGEAFPPLVGTVLNPGRVARGALVGGSLSTLAALAGTRYSLGNATKRSPDSILFFEEANERPYRIHRMLQQLMLSGDLESVRGVLIGDMRECVHQTGAGPTWEEVVLPLFNQIKVPVLKLTGYGHGPLNLPLPLGMRASIDADRCVVGAP
jgi:muramoyltetrapeptide carboxypeptidase